MSDEEREPHCPFHTMVEHLKLIDELFADWDPELLPLFPQPDGEEVPPQAIVALIEELARLTGEAVLTVDGRNRFGKHSFRATGAVFLSTVGIEVAKIRMLGRWSCAVVLHCTRLAPLKIPGVRFQEGNHRDILFNQALKEKPADPLSQGHILAEERYATLG